MLTASRKSLTFILLIFLFITLVFADPRDGGDDRNDGDDSDDGSPASVTISAPASESSTGLGGLKGDMQCPGSQVCIYHE